MIEAYKDAIKVMLLRVMTRTTAADEVIPANIGLLDLYTNASVFRASYTTGNE